MTAPPTAGEADEADEADEVAGVIEDAAAALQARVDGEVRFDAGTRAAYSTDASNFRQVPIGVVVPRTIDAAVEAIAVCREHQLPVVNRGGGTSLAGQCTNAAVMIDFAKYCHRLVSVDVERRRCVVEPGDRPRRAEPAARASTACASAPNPPRTRTAPWAA